MSNSNHRLCLLLLVIFFMKHDVPHFVHVSSIALETHHLSLGNEFSISYSTWSTLLTTIPVGLKL